MSKDFSPSPEIVAQSFVKQYYEVLTNNPGELYRFYKADSFFTFCQAPQTEEAISGAEAMKNYVPSLGFAGTRINLSDGSIDAQKSGTGIALMVTGELILPRSSPRQFVQTFFLAGDNHLSFYVRNSILRLLAESTGFSLVLESSATQTVSHAVEEFAPPVISVPASTTAIPVVASTPAVPAAAATANVASVPAVAESIVEVQVSAPAPIPTAEVEQADDLEDAPAPENDDGDDEVGDGEDDAAADADEEDDTGADDAVAYSPVVEEVQSVQDTSPKSWADRLKGAAAAAAAVQAPAAASPAVRVRRAVPTAAAARPTTSAATAGAAEGEAGASTGAASKKKEEFSLYVSKIPENTTQEELTLLFSAFGVVVKAEAVAGKGYAFVQVDSEAALQRVLSHGVPLEIRGTTLTVEEKNSKGGGGGGSGRRGDRSRRGGGGGGGGGGERSGDRPPGGNGGGDRGNKGAGAGRREGGDGGRREGGGGGGGGGGERRRDRGEGSGAGSRDKAGGGGGGDRGRPSSRSSAPRNGGDGGAAAPKK